MAPHASSSSSTGELEGREVIDAESASAPVGDAGAEVVEWMARGPLPADPVAEPVADPGSDLVVDPSGPRETLIGASAARRGRRLFRGRFWRDLTIGAGLVVLTHLFLVQVSVVRGLSMSPSLKDGDRLMVDRISYSLAEVSRFDVVVLRYPRNPSVDFVKRIVGLPGDKVDLHNGMLSVNGEQVPESFAHICDMHADGTWVVPHDSFFVLGDNRPISCDSREFGMVKRDLLKGKVRACFWPLDRFTFF